MKYQSLEAFLHHVADRNPGQPEYLQAVTEVMESLWGWIAKHPQYAEHGLLDRIVEPERVVMFRVAWVDDHGEVKVNRGYRIQHNSAIGPYKGGLRFHPTVTLGVLKFLAFEQVLKNSLTTLPMGGGKGGADFNPKGRSDTEVMRFCQSFMTELQRYIGPFTDIPAGDIGVGSREIGFLFGQYKKIRNEFSGVVTGKGLNWGGSLIRPDATGYGTVYFAEEMAKTRDESLEGKTCLVSGSGNVAQYTVEKLLDLGAKPVTLSDSGGFVYDKDGIDREKLAWVIDLKEKRRGRIMQYTEQYPSATFTPVDPSRATNPLWSIPAEAAFPSATHNEITDEDAGILLENGCYIVAEGANMPTEPLAIERFVDGKILYGPGKAANAGGVAVSGLEMSQNAERRSWTRETVDERLHTIMVAIHTNCRETADEYDVPGNYVHGANIAGFRKVADAMLAQGVV